MSQITSRTNRERKLPDHFAPGTESSRNRKGQGAKGQRSESSRERYGQGPIGRFVPGSELARERKSCESQDVPFFGGSLPSKQPVL